MNFEGVVQNGVVVLDAGHLLPDGTRVEVTVRNSTASMQNVDVNRWAGSDDSIRLGDVRGALAKLPSTLSEVIRAGRAER